MNVLDQTLVLQCMEIAARTFAQHEAAFRELAAAGGDEMISAEIALLLADEYEHKQARIERLREEFLECE